MNVFYHTSDGLGISTYSEVASPEDCRTRFITLRSQTNSQGPLFPHSPRCQALPGCHHWTWSKRNDCYTRGEKVWLEEMEGYVSGRDRCGARESRIDTTAGPSPTYLPTTTHTIPITTTSASTTTNSLSKLWRSHVVMHDQRSLLSQILVSCTTLTCLAGTLSPDMASRRPSGTSLGLINARLCVRCSNFSI